MLAKLAKDLVTEKDGVSFCPLRLGFIVALLGYTAAVGHDFVAVTSYVFSDHAKDIAEGYSKLLGWGGVAIAGKNYTEAE